MNSSRSLTHGTILKSELLPIREVAMQTGVDPVTLRTWERRYGLINPLRTIKGHRLYPSDQIERIHKVLACLQQGIAIEHIRALLQKEQAKPQTIDSYWLGGVQQWLGFIENLDERQLERSFNDMLEHYPPAALCRSLLLPLLEKLELRWNCQPAVGTSQVFFLSWLRNTLGARIAHNNRTRSGAPLLMLNLSDRPMEPGFWLSAWMANSTECPLSLYEWNIPPENIAFAIAKLKPSAVVLYADGSVKEDYLRAVLDIVKVPMSLCGHVVSIHHEILGSMPDIQVADTPIATLQCLEQLGLLGDNFRENRQLHW